MQKSAMTGKDFYGKTDLVVSGQSVNPALYQNQTELAILVLTVDFQMLAHHNSFLDHVVQVLWDVRGHTCSKQYRSVVDCAAAMSQKCS